MPKHKKYSKSMDKQDGYGKQSGYDLSKPEGYNADFIGGAKEPYGMPQHIIIKEWPKCQYDNEQYYDYGIDSQDRQVGADIKQMKKHRSKDRY